MVSKPEIESSGSIYARAAIAAALRPAEWLMLAMVLALGAACLVLVATMGRIVEWQGFALGIFAAMGIIAVGGYARVAKDAQRLANCAIGVGLFMGFTAFSTVFIYALFPLPRPMIDLELMVLDARLGYNWVGFVEGLATMPMIGTALGWLYMSSLGQIIFVILLLGVMGREEILHRFLMVGILTMICAVSIWWLWPSVGPSAWSMPDDKAARSIGLVFTPQYGAILLDLVQNGPAVIRSEEITGMVAFPSYHIIMALMVAWFSVRTPFFIPLALSSIAMVPATLSHGGHHLVDLIVGCLVFFSCLALTARLIPLPKKPHQPGRIG